VNQNPLRVERATPAEGWPARPIFHRDKNLHGVPVLTSTQLEQVIRAVSVGSVDRPLYCAFRRQTRSLVTGTGGFVIGCAAD